MTNKYVHTQIDRLRQKHHLTISGQENGQPMIFAHGYGCDQRMWRYTTPAFEDRFQVVLFDHVGSGKSDMAQYDFRKYQDLDGYADDIIELCDDLSFEQVILVCHSVSCMMGLLAAIKRPDLFNCVIMIGPSPCYLNDGSYNGGFYKEDIADMLENLETNYLGWSSAMAPVVMGNPDRPHLAEELENSFCQNDPKIARHFAEVTFLGDNRKDLSKMQIPSLIVQCSADVIAPKSVGDYLAQHLPNSTFQLLEANGHCPHLSHPTETIQVMRAFLSKG